MDSRMDGRTDGRTNEGREGGREGRPAAARRRPYLQWAENERRRRKAEDERTYNRDRFLKSARPFPRQVLTRGPFQDQCRGIVHHFG